MRILFCSRNALSLRLGAGKHLLELAEELERQGHRCTLVSDEDVCPGVRRLAGMKKWDAYAPALRQFLRREAARHDAVDYDHVALPFPRAEFPSKTLFVSRSMLLVHHFDHISLPRPGTARAVAGSLLKGRKRLLEQQHRVARAERTCREADLINVLNDDDLDELLRRGHARRKIVVIPIGLTAQRHAELGAAGADSTRAPRVAFVGTFDLRKGALELPRIVEKVAVDVPDVRFRLLGALYRSEDQILRYFPRSLYSALEVIPRFEPEELPALLAACSVGIFPSHLEGFGFGVLEMLAAGLPVVGYRGPALRETLTDDLLVARGDADAMAGRVVQLLRNQHLLREKSDWARRRAGDYLWPEAARKTAEAYGAALESLRRG